MPSNYPPTSVIVARRLIAIAILCGIILGVVAGVSALFGWVGALMNPSPAPTLVAGAECQAQQISVEAKVGTANSESQTAFNPDENPYFWFTLTNIGSVSCKLNAGSSVTFYTITSGSDRIWSSKDCLEVLREDTEITLNPNEPISAQPSDWQRVRSTISGCSIADDQVPVEADGASYFLEAEVNGILSSNKPQFVLN